MEKEEAGSVRWCWAVREVSIVIIDDEDQTSQEPGCCCQRRVAQLCI